jgi:hydrogenase maturation protein HypF
MGRERVGDHEDSVTQRRRIVVRGIVQGVGFRPFVFRLARRHELAGWVMNDGRGVIAEVEGEPASLSAFVDEVATQAPPLALVASVEWEEMPVEGGSGFSIRASDRNAAVATLISPDIAVCDDCLAEMRHPGDRRHRYPFINCTNCGPRYTIIEDIPYDRPRTSMKGFAMCPACAAEYSHPDNRRFHAQPNACPECGPRLSLLDGAGRPSGAADPLAGAIGLLRAGRIVAVKGLGGFHLAVDATGEEAVRELRRRKARDEKPLAVMVRDVAAAADLVHLGPEEVAEIASPRRPILLARRRRDARVAAAVAPGCAELGVMLPYTPLHHLLFDEGGFAALVMTSANISEEPICADTGDALRRLGGIADAYLTNDRPIVQRADDSVVRIIDRESSILRRSRGYAPAPVIVAGQLPPALGMGAELKNSVCLVRGNCAFLSQHVGDVGNEEAGDFFDRTVEHLERILECRANIVAHDLHPDYHSTRRALASGRPTTAVQHHHAHAASCMAENRLDGTVLAVTFDGAGLGDDGHVWGGEFLAAGYTTYRRLAHLREVGLPGLDAAAREPVRMAVSYLHQLYGAQIEEAVPWFTRCLPRERLRVLTGMLDRGVNVAPTSSAGRLFDAVAGLLGVRERMSFEGQAAMELEFLAAGAGEGTGRPYPYQLDKRGGMTIIDTLPVIEGICRDASEGVPPATAAGRFHTTLAAIIADTCVAIRETEGLDRVVLSGGVFQNLTLLGLVTTRLREAGFAVHRHRRVPTNDGGISLGQACIAAERLLGGARCA